MTKMTCNLTRNAIRNGESVIIFPIYQNINFPKPDFDSGWKFCLHNGKPMPLYGRYGDYGLFYLENYKVSSKFVTDLKGGKHTVDFLCFLKSNLLQTKAWQNPYREKGLKPNAFLQEVEDFFKSGKINYSKPKIDFKIDGQDIFACDYLLIKSPDNPNQIANLRFAIMSYPIISQILNQTVEIDDLDLVNIQSEKETDDFDICVKYFMDNVPFLKPTMASMNPSTDEEFHEVFESQWLNNKSKMDLSSLFQQQTEESKFCSLTLLPINKGDTCYILPIQYKATHYGYNPVVMPNCLNYLDLELDYVIYPEYYHRKMNKNDVLKAATSIIKCKFLGNDLIECDKDLDIVNENQGHKFFVKTNHIETENTEHNGKLVNQYQLKTTVDQKTIYQDIFAIYIYDYILVSETAMQVLMDHDFKNKPHFNSDGISKAIKNIDALNVHLDWFDLFNDNSETKTIGKKIVQLCQLHAVLIRGKHDIFCTYSDMNGKRNDVKFDWFDIHQKMQNFYGVAKQ